MAFSPQFRCIEFPLEDMKGSPTTDPDKAKKCQCISDPEKMEAAVIEQIIKHFGQVQGTVLTKGDLIENFGYEGTSSSSNVALLLNGTLNISSLISIGVLAFINHHVWAIACNNCIPLQTARNDASI